MPGMNKNISIISAFLWNFIALFDILIHGFDDRPVSAVCPKNGSVTIF
jgi:hypothetical protein